jgi:crotonobetainyl-CoA:carnitine CoA-transferase CaiB-like acyl-CoA transferase
VNRNKRSVALDFEVDADRDLAFRLAREADVIIENFRPGLLDRFGLGYDDLEDSGVVYCSITAFGPGPKQSEPGYDIAMQALSGYMSITGTPSGDRPRSEWRSSMLGCTPPSASWPHLSS